MPHMTSKKTFIAIVFDISQTLPEFFNLSDNSTNVLAAYGPYIEIFTYSLFIDSIIQPDPSLIQLSILYKLLEKIYQR